MSSSNLETALQAKPAPVLCPKRPRLLLLLLPSPTVPAINDYGVSTLIEWATLLADLLPPVVRPLAPVRWHMRGVLLNCKPFRNF
jgi:hypothetical protein